MHIISFNGSFTATYIYVSVTFVRPDGEFDYMFLFGTYFKLIRRSNV